MSTIHLPQHHHSNPLSSHHSNPPSSHPHSHPQPSSVVSAAALNALLQSGPNSTREPKQADKPRPNPADYAAMQREVNDLGTQLNKKKVERILRNPHSESSEAILNKIDSLLTRDNIKHLMTGPNSQASTHTLNKIGTQLNEQSMSAVLNPIEAEQVEAYRKYVDSAIFDLKASLMKASPESRFEMVRSFAKKEHAPLTNIQRYMDHLKEKSTHLCDIATQVREVNEALQYALPDHWDRRDGYEEAASKAHARTYSFNKINESTLDRPSEIRDFVTDRDKLDLRGIRRQLKKQLRSVAQLSGASGEVMLNHSPAHNSTVVVVSGNQGEPAFVAKVFGRVKEQDLSI